MSRLIDADALLEEMLGITFGWREPRKDWKWYEDSVRNAPTIDAVPVVHGHWIDKPTGKYGNWQSYCSACKRHSQIGGIESNRHKPRCPWCGAFMDEVINDG